jgi:hypothetical protein
MVVERWRIRLGVWQWSLGSFAGLTGNGNPVDDTEWLLLTPRAVGGG